MKPHSTIRLQLHAGFTLYDAVEHVSYYASLGLSHLYLSPVTAARKGSTHGYDVIDHRHVDPQLGGEDALKALAQCARDNGLGLILDIVPNHMAAHPDNPWWRDMLQHGRASRFGNWFDIQWEPAQPWLRDKVLLPILSDMYDVALERGDIRLDHDGSSYTLDVHGLQLPLALGSFDDDGKTNHKISSKTKNNTNNQNSHQHTRQNDSGDKDLSGIQAKLADYDPSTPEGRDSLHALLLRQHYRLAWWQCASDQINWRRFFEISDLAGVRVEQQDVFDAVHELPLRLFEQGWIDGLRIDHVDGLAQPLAYCQQLYQAMCDRMPLRPDGQRDAQPWLVVEKILAHGEILDTRWAVDGTTGYDFMDAVAAVMHDPDGEALLTQYWHGIAGDERSVDDWRRDARALMVSRHFAAERNMLLETICQLAQTSISTRDASRQSLGRALDQLLIEFPVYRDYATQGSSSKHDALYLQTASDQARQRLLACRDFTAVRVLDFVVYWLKGGTDEDGSPKNGIAGDRVEDATPGASTAQEAQGKDAQGKDALQSEVMRRFQQLTPPLAAKALEDTVFYRYGRLLSRNDVGSDPDVFSMSAGQFHRWNQHRADTMPRTLNTTATHDHKRGEDVRARLTAISEQPLAWQNFSTRCLAALGQDSTIDPGAQGAQCYMLLQTIVGAWPLDLQPYDTAAMSGFIQRLQQWQVKALREAKQMTSWFYQDNEYEQKQLDRIDFLLSDPDSPGCRMIASFVSRIAPAGALNSLGAVVLRCTLPGVPDVYQGTELWDYSLVDPDNRRPVDMEKRKALLRDFDDGLSMAELLPRWRDGEVKQAILARCLRLRRQHTDLFMGGSYKELKVQGPLAAHVLAFMRRDAGACVVVVVSRFASKAVGCAGQTLELPLIPFSAWQDTRIMMPSGQVQGSWRDALSDHVHHPASGSIRAGAVLSTLPVAVLTAS